MYHPYDSEQWGAVHYRWGCAASQVPVPWQKNSIYEICRLYTQYVVNTYSDAVVVFNGYDGGASTKDEIHSRRAGNDIGASVSVSACMHLTMNWRLFLPTHQRIRPWLTLLQYTCPVQCITVELSQWDADYMICLLACSSAKDKPTVLLQMTLMCFSCSYTMLTVRRDLQTDHLL